MRIEPHLPVMFKVMTGWDPLQKLEFYTSEIVKNYPKDQLVECDAVGFGAALIKIDVIKRMQRPYFMSTTSAGEDVYFCKRAKEIGAKVFMDTSVKLGHIGIPPIIEEKDFERELGNKHRAAHGDWKGKERELSRAK